MIKAGDTVFSPYFEDGLTVLYTPKNGLRVSGPAEDYGAFLDSEGFELTLLGERIGDRPVFSLNPWTERAVTERPWEPEVGELVIAGAYYKVGKVTAFINSDKSRCSVRVHDGRLLTFSVSALRPFTPEAAYELLGEQPKEPPQPTQRPLKVGDRVKANEAAMEVYREKGYDASGIGTVTRFDGTLRCEFGPLGVPIYDTGIFLHTPNARVTLIEDQPADDQPFGPEDFIVLGYDTTGKEVVCTGVATNKSELHVTQLAGLKSRRGWINLDGTAAEIGGYEHAPITRHNPTK